MKGLTNKMEECGRLEEKYGPAIRSWLTQEGEGFILCIRDFCQGNRASLSNVRSYLRALALRIFAGSGSYLNEELIEDLEYRMFDLIGKYSSVSGNEELLAAIRSNLDVYLTEIFTEAKRQWNLNYYKMSASFEEIDPGQCLIAAAVEKTENHTNKNEMTFSGRDSARNVIDELVTFSKKRFHGDKTRKVAVNWLENPEKSGDVDWFASLAQASSGCTRVMLTRIKKSINRNYRLRRVGDNFVLTRTKSRAAKPLLIDSQA
jgi:hypothetical protein